ncbi:MAG TPA: succinate dehydrogenase cytochrome b subunit [Thermoanaerobaculia bacterium]|jgi:succinate dehydrogenase / fumarate reductase cytochrome b subunit|nr:succinate dehydrogenase cytochrome b subunit [Thermoanaerobaculia bacterium]
MAWFPDLYRSAVGKKAVMGATGIVLFAFVLGHMLGNLKLYLGPEAYNGYARFLRTVGEPVVPANVLLWLVRLVLIACVLLHVAAAWQLTRVSRAARPAAYVAGARIHTTYASRTMRWGGVIILLFVVYHLLHFTWGTVHPSFIPGDVYHNVVTGFQVWWVALFYVTAQLALGLHLYHGLWSMFQSLGWNHPRFNLWRNGFAHAFAWIVTAGNISFPVAVLTGLVGLR